MNSIDLSSINDIQDQQVSRGNAITEECEFFLAISKNSIYTALYNREL